MILKKTWMLLAGALAMLGAAISTPANAAPANVAQPAAALTADGSALVRKATWWRKKHYGWRKHHGWRHRKWRRRHYGWRHRDLGWKRGRHGWRHRKGRKHRRDW